MTRFKEVCLLVERRRTNTVRHFMMLLITLSGGTLTFLFSDYEAQMSRSCFLCVGMFTHAHSFLAGLVAYFFLTKNIDALLRAITKHEDRLSRLGALELRHAVQQLEDERAPPMASEVHDLGTNGAVSSRVCSSSGSLWSPMNLKHEEDAAFSI